MLKRIAPFLIALGLFFIIDLSISFTPLSEYLDDQVQNSLQKKLTQIKTDNPSHLDILVIGTSRTNNGFATETFEASSPLQVNAYNMGLHAGDYYIFKLVLNDHIKQYGKPRLILLEITDFMFNKNFISDNNTLYFRTLIANDPFLANIIFSSPQISFRAKQEIVFAMFSGMYRYRSSIAPKRIAKILLENRSKPRKFLQGWKVKEIRSFMDNENTIKESALERKETLLSFDHIDSSKLQDFLSFCKQEEIPVVLFQWPSHPAYTSLFEASPISKPYYQEIIRISQQFDYPFIDLEEETPSDIKGLYSDPGHLSRDGAILFTRRLAKKIFILEETRNYLNSQPGTPSRVLKKAHDER